MNAGAILPCAIALFLVSQHSQCADGDVEFKGAPIGTTERIFKVINPSFQCRDSAGDSTLLGDRMCQASSGEYGGVSASLWAFFYADRLLSAAAYLKPKDFDDVLGAMSLRFGKPKTTLQPYKTRGGLNLTNDVSKWKIGTVTIIASRYASSIDTSSVNYEDDEGAAEMAKRQTKKLRNGAKAL